MNPFSISPLAKLVSNKASTKDIDKIIEKLDIIPSDNLYAQTSETVHIAALQVMIRQYTSLADYILDMNFYIADAVNRRAQLICFPAYCGLLPLSLVGQYSKCLDAARPLETTSLPDPTKLHQAFSYCSDYMFEIYFHTLSSLAAKHRVYIMAGSTIYFENDSLCHRAFLFNHHGELAGYQDKISPTKLEIELGILPAEEIKLFETPIGSVCIAIDTDANYFEVAKIAKSLGAEFILSPACFTGQYSPIDTALGLNMRIQEQRMYGVQSALVGATGLGFDLESGCAIFAPNEMVKLKNGVLAKTDGRHQPDMVAIQINLEHLANIKNPYTQDKNSDFLNRYIDRLY